MISFAFASASGDAEFPVLVAVGRAMLLESVSGALDPFLCFL